MSMAISNVEENYILVQLRHTQYAVRIGRNAEVFCFFFSLPSSEAYTNISYCSLKGIYHNTFSINNLNVRQNSVLILDPLLPVCNLVWVTMAQSLSFLICTDINPFLAVKRYNKVPGTVLGAIIVAIIIIMPISELSQFLFQSYFLK